MRRAEMPKAAIGDMCGWLALGRQRNCGWRLRDEVCSIGFLDIYGFEVFDTNNFESKDQKDTSQRIIGQQILLLLYYIK